MAYSTLITVDELHGNLDHEDWVVMDCRFSLGSTTQGRENYLRAHIPGARYAHLDNDLSGPIIPGQTGRHPLPALSEFIDTLQHWGISKNTQVVAYDDMGGPFAARLWWMLRWLNHDNVAVLDGGFPAWTQKGYATTEKVPDITVTSYSPSPLLDRTFSAEDILLHLNDPAVTLLDARAADRHAGIHEPIDPVAGHIPGALSFPFKENLTKDGYFKSAEQLSDRFKSLNITNENNNIVCYCGSGVTAAHNILAMVHAGLPFPRMYPGSWSEWITDPERPIGKNADF